jgi:hypothetical protein
MTRVFIGGSRRISRLSRDVEARLDRIVSQGLPVLVGDANGADTAVQRYLDGKRYRNVEVFCSGSKCRNNVGDWPVRAIEVGNRKKDRAYFTVKDRAMTEEATVGLMLWDGKSLGTVNNVARLLHQGKPTVVYNAPERRFLEIRTREDWRELLALCSAELQGKIELDEVPAPAEERQTTQASLW